jgi:1,4-alpha-glucan branching enzyme
MADQEFVDLGFSALVAGEHGDPFGVLGPHDGVVRALLPGAKAVALLAADGETVISEMHPVHEGILFEGALPEQQKYVLRIEWDGGVQVAEDTYSYGNLLSDFDIYLLAEGRHKDLGSALGAHVMEIDGTPGVRFAVWAPHARRVSVVGAFNLWDGRRHPMRKRQGGIWEVFVPRLGPGEAYKYEILGPHGAVPLKADPVAWCAEIPPATSSVVADPVMPAAQFPPLRRTEPAGLDKPLSIYEVHAASWMRHLDGKPYGWDELAARLIPYAKDLGFTHIELLPVMAHPFGGSWGYQPLSQFAPMPVMGTPQDFARFVDACHAQDLGVILDWVPAHFPTDEHGLARFDGTAVYEHADPREGFHNDWNTLIFNLGRLEVRGFLVASALFWLEHFGVDGLRVDAVASMLYRDYSRKAGEWVPNIHGGRENLESIAFLQELSRAIEERCPGALLIAEESTAWPGVTKPADAGGLGFTHKWNMGWMHDTLDYFAEEPVNRQYHHDKMTFSLVYAFSEHFVLPISHDEVVHGKGSLYTRMPGDEWQKFANLRAYLAFMWTHPGKKLLFMGCEFGQPKEWNHDAELSWDLLRDEKHRGVQGTVRALNHVLTSEPALYERDFDPAGFQWIVGDDKAQSVLAFMRWGHEGTSPVLVVCNFTPVPRYDYRVGVPAGEWREIFNSDLAGYGGSDVGNAGVLVADGAAMHGMEHSLRLTLPPLAVILLRQV